MKRCLFASVLVVFSYSCFSQPNSFTTSKGLHIRLQPDGIHVNGKNLYPQAADMGLLINEPNRLIENGGAVFLFVHADGRPDKERLYGFRITDHKVDAVVDAISSDIRNMDDDANLEFGGADLTEELPDKDSMYYVPSAYYEISDGKIRHDSDLTINMDIRRNGVYLRDHLDAAGACCKVIPAPAKLVDPLIISERIDGPANVRDAVGGAVIFSLQDNVPVSTGAAAHSWYPVGLEVDLSSVQYKSGVIEKGSPLYVDGKVVGQVMKDLPLTDASDDHGHLTGLITGYTAVQNIRRNTQPEVVLCGIIGQHTAGLAELKDFLRGYGFSEGTRCEYTSYSLDEALAGPSAPMRLELLFEGKELFGVIHRRKLPGVDMQPYELARDFLLTVRGDQPVKKVMAFIDKFNEVMKYAD